MNKLLTTIVVGIALSTSTAVAAPASRSYVDQEIKKLSKQVQSLTRRLSRRGAISDTVTGTGVLRTFRGGSISLVIEEHGNTAVGTTCVAFLELDTADPDAPESVFYLTENGFGQFKLDPSISHVEAQVCDGTCTLAHSPPLVRVEERATARLSPVVHEFLTSDGLTIKLSSVTVQWDMTEDGCTGSFELNTASSG